MNTIKKISAVLLIIGIVVATFFACNKEKETNVVTDENTETISKEDDMSAYLKQFKKKMQSSAKGGETLSMDDAQWHLEAVLNYTYGDAGQLTSDIQCDTFYYTIHTEKDEVPLYQLNEAFNAFSQNVEKAFGNCTLPDKSVLAIQTTFENESKSGDVVVRGVLTTRGHRPSTWPILFGETDYWWGDCYTGKCGPYIGECDGQGAVQQLQEKINANLPTVGCFTGHGYFTDIFTIQVDLDDSLMDPLSPSGYRIPYFYWTKDPSCFCCSPDDLNYYLTEALKLVEEYKPNGKFIISMENIYMNAVPIGYHLSYHEYNFKYGRYHCYEDGNDY